MRTVGSAILFVNNLQKRYAHEFSLGPISISMLSGQVLALVGANGAGKSTLLRSILGLTPIDSGEALICAKPYRQLKIPMAVVGACLSGIIGDASMNAVEYLTLIAQSAGIRQPRRQVRYVIQYCGLEHWAMKSINRYSLGMHQRLSIASAIVGDPSLVVLDEPFNGLDSNGRQWLQEAISQWSYNGKAILIASHDIDELERVATHVVVLNSGSQVLCQPMRKVLEEFNSQAYVEFQTAQDVADVTQLIGALQSMGMVDRYGDVYRIYGVSAETVFSCAARLQIPLKKLGRHKYSLREALGKLMK